MADGFAAKDAAGTTIQILTDQVTDGVLGTGQKQLVGIVDASVDGTNKLIVDSTGYLNVRTAPKVPTVVSGNQGALTISSSAVALTVPSGATHAFISCETNSVRFWEDGTAPTATSGILLLAGESLELAVTSNTKFIRATGSDGTLQVSYRKYV